MPRRRRPALVEVGCRACGTRLAIGPVDQTRPGLLLELARANVAVRPCCALADPVELDSEDSRNIED